MERISIHTGLPRQCLTRHILLVTFVLSDRGYATYIEYVQDVASFSSIIVLSTRRKIGADTA